MNLIQTLTPKINQLAHHPLYESIKTHQQLKFFMENHVFAVFDFMSLTKAIQAKFAPVDQYWKVPQHPLMARFVNEVVLAEESDELPDGTFLSHFELYLKAMEEVGCDMHRIHSFLNLFQGENYAVALERAPLAARKFSLKTFDQVSTWQNHQIVASFCFGREKVIPLMFQKLIDELKIEAPMFKYYLQRHIDVDGDEHGPIALKMLELVCGNSTTKWQQAYLAADESIQQRIDFWSELQSQLAITHGKRSVPTQTL